MDAMFKMAMKIGIFASRASHLARLRIVTMAFFNRLLRQYALTTVRSLSRLSIQLSDLKTFDSTS